MAITINKCQEQENQGQEACSFGQGLEPDTVMQESETGQQAKNQNPWGLPATRLE